MSLSIKFLPFNAFTWPHKYKYVYNKISSRFPLYLLRLWSTHFMLLKNVIYYKNMVGSSFKNTQTCLIFLTFGYLFAFTKLFLESENTAIFFWHCLTFWFLNSKAMLLFRLQGQQEEHLLYLNLPFPKTSFIYLFRICGNTLDNRFCKKQQNDQTGVMNWNYHNSTKRLIFQS